jgi:hypothetical protein
VADEAPAPHGEELVPDEDPEAEPAVAMVVPALTAPLLTPDVEPLLEPEPMTALVPLPVPDRERPVRLPHPAMVSGTSASSDHRL